MKIKSMNPTQMHVVTPITKLLKINPKIVLV